MGQLGCPVGRMTAEGRARDRRRAMLVRSDVRELWGDEMPPTEDPPLTIFTDAVALDDQHGSADGLVVQGDGLRLEVLARLLADSLDPAQCLILLPPGLRQRVAGLLREAGGLP